MHATAYHRLVDQTDQQLRRPRPETYDISSLVSLAERGVLRIPRFQRPFTWDGEDVRKLFDSIWRGFPIGTLLLWKRDGPNGRVAFGPFEIDAPAYADALWVVDGQQRVASLVGALSARAADVYPDFELCFDLRQARFVQAGKRPIPSWWLPLRVTLESRTLIAWLRESGDDLSPDELERADALSGALRDYRVPAYVVEHADDDLLREVFDRVNSAGKPITRAQVFHALFGGSSDGASPSTVVEALRHEGFGDLNEQRVVQSLLAVRGGNVQRDFHDEFGAGEEPAEWLGIAERALVLAISFLRRHHAPHLLLLPHTLPIPVLAAFFHLHPTPDPWNERLLSRWLWRGWVHGYGRSGQTPALRKAVTTVHPVRGKPELAPSENDAVQTLLRSVPDDSPPTPGLRGFRTDAASGRLALLALASLGPLRPNGGALAVNAALNHDGAAAVTELVEGHRGELAARGFWPLGAAPPTGAEQRAILDSHAIDVPAAEALRSGRVDEFLDRRGDVVVALVGRFLAARIDRGAPVRAPLSELFVPDDALAAG